MKMKRKVAGLLMVGALVLGMAGCQSGGSSEMKIGTGDMGGTYYAYGSALAGIFGDAQEGTAWTVKSTAGSASNLRLLSQGFLQMAIVQSDTLSDAVNGEGAFDKALEGYHAVAGLYTEDCQLIVRADADIDKIADLAGKRVSIGEDESGVRQNAEDIFAVNGLTEDMIEAKTLSFSDSAKAMANGELDAFFCTAGVPTTVVATLAEETDIKLLSMDDDAVERLMNMYDGYTSVVIPAGTYEGQDEEVKTVGVKAVLIASDSLENDTVEMLTKTLFENGSKLQYATQVNTSLDLTFATSDIPVDFHAGAAAYYKAAGIEVNEGKKSTGAGVSGGQDK